MADEQQPIKKSEVQTLLDQLRNLRAGEGSRDAALRASIDQQIRDAKQLYQERAGRNEWLDLAKNIGQALTRYGAARAGMRRDEDLSNLQFMPGKDYGADTGRAFEEYRTERGDIERMGDILRRQREQELQPQEADLSRRLSIAREDERAKAAEEAAGRREKASERRQTRSLEAMEERARKVREESARKEQLKDLNSEQGEVVKRLNAAGLLALDLQSEDKNTRREASKRIPSLLERAGTDPEVYNQIKQESMEPGWLWGQNESPEKRREAYQRLVIEPLKARLQQLKQKENELRGGSAAPAATMRVRLKSTGETGTIPEAEFDPNLYEKI